MPNSLNAPNLHAVLLHYPIALLSLALFIEVLSFCWRRSSVRAAARWMALAGIVTCIPALSTGIDAYADALGAGGESLKSMAVHGDQHLNPQQISFMHRHMLLTSIASGLLAIQLVLYLALSDAARQKFHVWFVLGLLVAVALLFVGAWHGGESVYRLGVSVQRQSEGAASGLEYYIPSMQLHVFLAGFIVSLALVALGLSIRSMLHGPWPPQSPRWWVLAAVLTVGAIAAGLWAGDLLEGLGTWRAIRERMSAESGLRRELAHVILGVSILALTIALAAATRWAHRNKLLLFVLSLSLFLVLAVQWWLGILLLFDGFAGPLYRFNPYTPPT